MQIFISFSYDKNKLKNQILNRLKNIKNIFILIFGFFLKLKYLNIFELI